MQPRVLDAATGQLGDRVRRTERHVGTHQWLGRSVRAGSLCDALPSPFLGAVLALYPHGCGSQLEGSCASGAPLARGERLTPRDGCLSRAWIHSAGVGIPAPWEPSQPRQPKRLGEKACMRRRAHERALGCRGETRSRKWRTRLRGAKLAHPRLPVCLKEATTRFVQPPRRLQRVIRALRVRSSSE